jgi:N-acetylglucosaminyldiphosphoundecaprenol N-acetyl-beta-D-mannosaminyltransferase
MTPIVRINAIPIANVSMDEALDRIDGAIERSEKRCVFFVNADCVNISAVDPRYLRVLQRSDAWVFGDGLGIRIAARISRQPVKDNVNGTDMFPRLCERCATSGRSIFLVGAKPGVAEEVKRRMEALQPGLIIAGAEHGYHEASQWGEVVERVNASKADVVLVAFGAPRQEMWIAEHRETLDASVAMGVGGLFDFCSGRMPRAPKLVRQASLEWAWRLAMEPRRLWRRYVIGNFRFMGRVVWSELRRMREP